MRKTIIALVATVCILVAAPLAFAAAISFTIFHAVLLIGRGNWRGWLGMVPGGVLLPVSNVIADENPRGLFLRMGKFLPGKAQHS